MPGHETGSPQMGRISCSYCGVGDGGTIERSSDESEKQGLVLPVGPAALFFSLEGQAMRLTATIAEGNTVSVEPPFALTPPGGLLTCEIEVADARSPLVLREIARERGANGALRVQRFQPYQRHVSVTKEATKGTQPTSGCIKLKHSTMRQRAAYPIHIAPSVRDSATGGRRAISYTEAIARLADLLLAHTEPGRRTLVYASGQIDYFTIFAMQEVLRLLGIRNLTGNAEHCLNAGAVHNEILTGQEGPFLTLEQAANGPGRFFLFNGWNGFVTHPPVFRMVSSRPDFDGFLFDVVVTESAKVVAKQLGKERVLLLRPRSDPHVALSVAHAILTQHRDAVHADFIERFCVPDTFGQFSALAGSEAFAPERVASRVAAEPEYEERILHGIRLIARKLVSPGSVPINIPSVGLSQSSGVVAHCLWGCAMAMVGKFGLNSDGTPAGGTLRLPGQINAESEVQGLSRKYFMGRIPMSEAAEAARRMELPDDAYDSVLADAPRAALDYSDPTPGVSELFLCVGTQFESNMIGRKRWIDKLTDPNNRLVVIDPIPDPFSEQHAELIIPSPPHPATTKLYQNGEWKLTLSIPQKHAAPETRSDATILYDAMAEITRRIESEPALAAAHPDLARHVASGYLRRRFCPPQPEAVGGLTRIDGEVSRAELWQRIMTYMSGGRGALYCRFEHADGRPILWTEMVEKGFVYYGGVGQTRFRLDYDDPSCHPFRDIYRRPGAFKFFVPTPADLEIPDGVVMNSGRSSLSDDRDRVAFATGSFNSGKATPIVNMPDEHPLYIAPALAEKHGLKTGDHAKVINRVNGAFVELPVVVSDRAKGNTIYVSFHKSRAQMERGVYVNDATNHEDRCAYTAQTRVKVTSVHLERVQPPQSVDRNSAVARRSLRDTTHIDHRIDLPAWAGQETLLYVTDIVPETHDVNTFRFQGDPPCRFVFNPGQFGTLVLNIHGKRVLRSYSISSTPTRPYVLEMTIKRVPGGLVSNWLPDNLKPGDRVEIAGPKGKFCLEPGQIPKKLLLLGAGSGVTPMMAMARWLCDVSADVNVRFFNCVRTPDDVIFGKEIEMLTQRYRIFEPVVISASRGANKSWTGLTGHISKPMIEMVAPDLLERHVYMCGPPGFMELARTMLGEMGFDLAKLYSESFGGIRAAVPGPGGGANVGADETDVMAGFTVQFARAGKTARSDGKLPLLDVAEAHDVDVAYGCRAGSCGECKIKLLRGAVDTSSEEGLSGAERAAGFVLSCVATPKGDCVVDA